MPPPSKKNDQHPHRYRTCCNIWHIRTGTALLGLLELIAVAILFTGMIRQLIWKGRGLKLCANKKWRDCLIFNFSTFNLTLLFDYLVAILLLAISLSILLLFYGLLTSRPSFLRPHLLIQAMCLLSSLTYFFLYAWSYLYGDLYTQRRSFRWAMFIERMWLATLLLVFAIMQCYLFFVVLKCCLYLNMVREERRRKEDQFEEVSQRVKLAKENGLWRSTSWGGGFQQYRGQYEQSSEKTKGKKPKDHPHPPNRVQWDLGSDTHPSPAHPPKAKVISLREGMTQSMCVPSQVVIVKKISISSKFT